MSRAGTSWRTIRVSADGGRCSPHAWTPWGHLATFRTSLDVPPGVEMSNERLRSALLAQGMTVYDLAEAIEVNPKTVERWITQGKVPYRRHQYATASVLKVEVTTLWEDSRTVDSATDLSKAEIVTVYPHRHMVPVGLWREIYGRAQSHVDVLVYAGLWLSEDPKFIDLLKAKVQENAQVRVLLGDPGCAAVKQRGIDEGHEIMDGKIRNALMNYRPLFQSHPGHRLPSARRDALQLAVSSRRRDAREHPRLRHRRVHGTRPAPATPAGRRALRHVRE